MSYSYECNVVCNLCENATVSAGVDETPAEAKAQTDSKAERLGWFNEYGEYWVCPDCIKRVISKAKTP